MDRKFQAVLSHLSAVRLNRFSDLVGNHQSSLATQEGLLVATAQSIAGVVSTNSNESTQGQHDCPLPGAEAAPLGKSGGTVGLKVLATKEAAFLVEVI